MKDYQKVAERFSGRRDTHVRAAEDCLTRAVLDLGDGSYDGAIEYISAALSSVLKAKECEARVAMCGQLAKGGR